MEELVVYESLPLWKVLLKGPLNEPSMQVIVVTVEAKHFNANPMSLGDLKPGKDHLAIELVLSLVLNCMMESVGLGFRENGGAETSTFDWLPHREVLKFPDARGPLFWPPYFSKIATYLERIPSTDPAEAFSAVRLFIVCIDPLLNTKDMMDLWIAMCNKRELSYLKEYLGRIYPPEAEEDGAPPAKRIQIKKRPYPPCYNANAQLTHSKLALKTVGAMARTIFEPYRRAIGDPKTTCRASLDSPHTAFGPPVLAALYHDDADADADAAIAPDDDPFALITDITVALGSHANHDPVAAPMNGVVQADLLHPYNVLGATGFNGSLMTRLKKEGHVAHPSQLKYGNYRDDAHALCFPHPEHVYFIPPIACNPQNLWNTPFPWHANKLANAFNKLLDEVLPQNEAERLREGYAPHIAMTNNAPKETDEVRNGKKIKHTIRDRAYALREINVNAANALSSIYWRSVEISDVLKVSDDAYFKAVETFQTEMRSRWLAAMGRDQDISTVYAGIYEYLQSPEGCQPGVYIGLDMGFDNHPEFWSAHQVCLCSVFAMSVIN